MIAAAVLIAAALLAETPAYKPPPEKLPEDATATKLGKELMDLQAKGLLLQAAAAADRRLRHMERKVPDAADPRLEPYVNDAARLAMSTGDYGRSEELYLRSATMTERFYGVESENYATALDQVAIGRWIRGDYEEAGPLMARSLEIRRRLHGEESLLFAVRLLVAAGFATSRYDYVEAERLYEAALAIHRKIGSDAASVAGVVSALAWMHKMRGDPARAEAFFREALELYRGLGPHMTSTLASFTSTLADVLDEGGKPEEAKAMRDESMRLYRTGVEEAEAQYGAGSAMALSALRMLASQLQYRKQLEEARVLHERILASEEAQHGKGAPALQGTLMALAKIAEDQGDFETARRHYEVVLRAQRAAWGRVQSLGTEMMLAGLDEKEGLFAKAARRMEAVAKGYEASFGPGHPVMSPVVLRVGMMRWAEGKLREAVRIATRAQELLEPTFLLQLQTGTEKDRKSALERSAYHLDAAVSLNAAAPADLEATRLGLLTVLRRKGRLLDAMADTLGSLRRRLGPEERKLFDDLASARARLAALVTKGPQAGEEAIYRKTLAELDAAVRRLETDVSLRSKEYRAQNLEVSIEAVQARIPEGAALVELAVYGAVDPRKAYDAPGQGVPHYAAWVIGRDGPPAFVPLGPAAPIAEAVPILREALADPDVPDVEKKARAVDALVTAPIRRALGDRRRVLLAPDGALHLVPFAALVDEDGRYLVERFHFTYLTSGRDLLRLDVKVEGKGGPVIFAAPDFDGTGAPAPKPPGGAGPEPPPGTRGRRALDLASLRWAPLPGTAGEAEALRGVLPGAGLWTGPDATEEALKEVSAPSILHVATHGFFLPDAGAGAAENPLLRSGLALTGANRLRSVVEDGVLTALEASGIDLWGTQLVVLSACETGVGQVKVGEGVYGLRRALVLAGSESQVLSLWQVDDDATRELMTGFYRRLLDGEGRGDALRSMQLRMLRSPDLAHPFYWSSFVPAGEWRPLRR